MNWTYFQWWDHRGDVDQPEPLRADRIIEMHRLERRYDPTDVDWLLYMEMAYVSCRVLMISSELLHLEAFYCAAQTLERGMKAVLSHQSHDIQKGQIGHDLEHLAKTIGSEFDEPEFVELCRRLTVFQEAGRYPDNYLSHFSYPLTLLTFLDGFVVRCRKMCGLPEGAPSWTARAVTDGRRGNEVQRAAVVAISDKNRSLRDLGVNERS